LKDKIRQFCKNHLPQRETSILPLWMLVYQHLPSMEFIFYNSFSSLQFVFTFLERHHFMCTTLLSDWFLQNCLILSFKQFVFKRYQHLFQNILILHDTEDTICITLALKIDFNSIINIVHKVIVWPSPFYVYNTIKWLIFTKLSDLIFQTICF
jgi:hypothetical protein